MYHRQSLIHKHFFKTLKSRNHVISSYLFPLSICLHPRFVMVIVVMTKMRHRIMIKLSMFFENMKYSFSKFIKDISWKCLHLL